MIEISPVTLSLCRTDENQHLRRKCKKYTDVDAHAQILHLFLEQIQNLLPGGLSSWNLDAIGGARGDVDHFLEFGMIQGINRLVQ